MAETKVIVRVLKTHEELVEVYARNRLEAEAEAMLVDGVIAVLEIGYPEDMPNPDASPSGAKRSEATVGVQAVVGGPNG